MLKVLSKINEPNDLKCLTIDELNILAEENKENWHWTMPFDRYDAEELLENLGITPEKIMEEAKRYTN